ncbi:HEAT repeat domain-containing protein [Mycobacterium sp. pUA109]|uniref:HEAT repeat domain-containing protein n=1 Tax=Mycobacterium sp. pUA109 TaxID=3238982 RepID=UPI00351ABB90
MTDVDHLLETLEPLNHDERMRRMVELGREATSSPHAAGLIAALSAGGFFERLLALHSCYGSKDGSQALAALHDPSRTISGRAVKLVAAYSDDEPIIEVLQGLRADLRLALLRGLRRRGRLTVIDGFLDALAGADPHALGPLLPFGSPAVVAEHFETARRGGGATFWERLARRHPDLTVQRLTETSEQPDLQLLWEANTALPILAKWSPDRGVQLAQWLIRHGSVRSPGWTMLALRRPVEVADLLLGLEEPASISLAARAHRLDNPRLLALLEQQPGTLPWPTFWFPRLPAERRSEIYRYCGRLWRGEDGCADPKLVAALPRDLREAEGRRHLDLPALATHPAFRLSYAAFVPWAQARRVADPFLNHPDAELRSAALQALIGAVRFQRARLGELLTALRDRRYEQDPVRCAVFAGLAQLPPSSWKPEHLPDLAQILRDALSAADLSHGTASYAQTLVRALLPFHLDWSLGWLVTFAGEYGQLVLPEHELTDAQLRRLAPALTPVLATWQAREREPQLLALARTLGRRLSRFPELIAMLVRLLQDTKRQWVAAAILSLLAQHHRVEFTTLIPALIRDDPSWVTQTPVLEFLHRRRQDLLTPLLGRRAYQGRFATGHTRYVLPLSRGFFRWTPTQQREFAATLDELTQVTADPRDIPTVLRAMTQLAALPAVAPTRLSELARDARPGVQEAALRALGKLDAGQGVPALLEALADERSRIAIYALRRTVLALPVTRALRLLQTVPLDKITVAKECARLLGDLPGEDAFRVLQRLDGRSLPRDVRVALLRALWRHLDRPHAWEIVDRAVDSADPVLMAAVVRIPADRLSDPAQRRLAALLARVLAHPDPAVRMPVLQRCIDLPPPDREQALLPGLLSSLTADAPAEQHAAAVALFTICRPPDAARIAAGIRDALPNRRALVATVQALLTALPGQHARLRPIAHAILGVLADDPMAVHLRLQLAGQVLAWHQFAGLLDDLAASGEWHADAVAAGIAAVGSWTRRSDRADLEALETRLASHADDRMRRLALAALVAAAALPGGWSAARLDRLRGYRRDHAPLVAAAAQFTLPLEDSTE